MKLSDYIRIGLTAGIAVNVWLETGKWTALAITILLLGAECTAYVLNGALRHIDALISLIDCMQTNNDDQKS